ncbi:MAG: aldo/keto reductase, partial [Clostridiales bacterium]|nr:aldo/keto reductase [Clostridiales bacterium]
MEKRNFNGRDISLLGFGLMRLPRKPGNPSDIDLEASSKLVDFAIANGINYFDTAYTYDGSEAFAGCALSNYSRDTYCLATKCPPWKIKNTDDFERIFAEQLARCRTGYFDFYLVHNMAQESRRAAGNEEYFESFVRLGMHEMLKRKKAEGKIRNIGFSFHGTADLLLRLVDRYEWDFSQVQVNYIDWITTDAKRQYEILTEHNIPVVVMEPLRGGTMATLSEDAAALLKKARPGASLASWGIRYAASLPNVVTVLSGMNEMGQRKDNIATMDGFQPVTEAEKEVLYEA